jgi:hypothetical protein
VVANEIGDLSEASRRQLWRHTLQAHQRCRSFSNLGEAYQIVFTADRHQALGKDKGVTSHVER